MYVHLYDICDRSKYFLTYGESNLWTFSVMYSMLYRQWNWGKALQRIYILSYFAQHTLLIVFENFSFQHKPV